MNIVRRRGLGFKGGFTLIELLVVIAIIGILSSVVLVSLNSARTKGVSTRVQEDAANIRTQLETDYTGAYYPDLTTPTPPGIDSLTAGSFTAGNLATLKSDITTEGGNLKIYDNGGTSATINAYAIYVYFPSSSGGYCVDSTGNTKTTFTGVTAFTAASSFVTCAASTGL